MSIWRDVQESGSNSLSGWVSRARGHVKVMGADETVLKVKGKRTVVGFVTDAATGQLLGMDVLVERDSEGFIKWLEGYVNRFGGGGDGDRRPVDLQAGGRASRSGAPGMHSPC